MRWPAFKIFFLVLMVIIYIGAGLGFSYLIENGTIKRSPPPAKLIDEEGSAFTTEKAMESFEAGAAFLNTKLRKESGHIDLYYPRGNRSDRDAGVTSSEAVSYYLLWNALSGRKEDFDTELNYLEKNMLHPNLGYLMWKLDQNGRPVDDGENIASAADLRALRALLIAEGRWGDARYTQLINRIAAGVEKASVTSDGYLAPYGGFGGEDSSWSSEEAWLSYADFSVIRELAYRRGEPWITMYKQSREAILNAQLVSGLYNTMLTEGRQHGNGIDNGAYSTNSMLIMVNAAQSNDTVLMESARNSLNFYKREFDRGGGILYSAYTSSGDPFTSYDSPWVYALASRAATALGDYEFSRALLEKLTEYQSDEAELNGAFIDDDSMSAGQFMVQESLVALQEYIQSETAEG